MASRKKSCEKKQKRDKKERKEEKREKTEEPAGTPPLELEEGGPIYAFIPLQKQGNSMCS